MSSSTLTHPRIEERREAVAEQRARSRSRRYLLVAAIVALALGIFGLTRSPFLDVEEIRVIGAQRTSPTVVRDVAALEIGAPLTGLDLVGAEHRLEAMPSVIDATVTKTWRGLVTYSVEERVPVAYINLESGVMLVAADGVVVDIVDRPEPGLPLIAGAMFRSEPGLLVPEAMVDPVAVATALPSDLTPVTEQIELSVDQLVLRLVGGGRVSLGDARDLDAKFDAVRAVLDRVSLDCLDQINVVAPLLPSVERLGGCGGFP